MAAHRTWGVFFVAGNLYTQLSEVAFLDAVGGDLSTGGAAAASSEYGAGYEAWRAFDKSNSTDWRTAGGDSARRLWYVHPAPVEVEKLRIRMSATGYIPSSANDISVRWSDTLGATWSEFGLRVKVDSGSFAASQTVVMSLLPALALAPLPAPGRLEQNFLAPQFASTGVVSDRVMFKSSPSSPEAPFARDRVWLLRLADGRKAWEGWSDADGYYTATGLELGEEYIAVGIDPQRNHKATGAGPVVATATGSAP